MHTDRALTTTHLQRGEPWLSTIIAATPPAPEKLEHWPSTPEELLRVLPKLYQGNPLNMIDCALDRARAVTILLSTEFAEPERDRLNDYLVVSVLWDIQGQIETVQHLMSRLEVTYAGH